jgi:hypothetical protein
MKDSGMFSTNPSSTPESKRSGKKGLSIGQPWSGGRPNGPEHSRRSSNKNGMGPARPSASRASGPFGSDGQE